MMNQTIVVSTFYKFVRLPDYQELQAPLKAFCKANDIYGTMLLAEEGINATIAGARKNIDAVLAHLQTHERYKGRFANLTTKESVTDTPPFDRMKVRLKQEIVRLKVPGINPAERVGTYVAPQQWNQLISAPDVTVIDTRNDFEAHIGTFEGAINPRTDAFHELPQFIADHLDPTEHRKVAMFCTGGIRCEKATAYLLEQGFEEVYHLKGGILQYLQEVPEDDSLWQGECFVFDDRVSVNHHLQPGMAVICKNCGAGLPHADAACSHCIGNTT